MSVGVRLCRIVGRSDVFVVEFSVLTLSLNTPLSLHKLTFFMNSQAHSFSLKTHTSSNKHNRVQIWAWEEQ